MHPRLSSDAKTLYGILMSHSRARTGYTCFVGYATLCRELGAGEDRVRRAMRRLQAEGIVAQTRYGRGRVNRYRLLVTPPPREPRDLRVLEPADRGVALEEQGWEEEVGAVALETVSIASRTAVVAENAEAEPPAASDVPSPSPPSGAVVVRREADDKATSARAVIHRYVEDIAAKELRDAAPTSTTTRLLRLRDQAGTTTDALIVAMLAARATTRRHLAGVKRRGRDGAARATPYWVGCIERELGLKPLPPRRHNANKSNARNDQDETYPVKPVAMRAMNEEGSELPYESQDVPPSELVWSFPSPDFDAQRGAGEGRGGSAIPEAEREVKRAALWVAIREATGSKVTNLDDYCRLAGRPPIMHDFERSVEIIRRAMRNE